MEFQNFPAGYGAWFPAGDGGKKKQSLVFDTPQVFDFSKVDSDAALLPSRFNW